MAQVRLADFTEWNVSAKQIECLRLAPISMPHEVYSIATPVGVLVGEVVRYESYTGFQHQYTRLRFVWAGRRWYRTWRREWTGRTISRLAREMAWEISGGW